MSSYIIFSFVKKEALDNFNKEYDRIKALPGNFWDKDYSSARKFIEGNKVELFYQSRSGGLYSLFTEGNNNGYLRYTVITLEMVNECISKVKNSIEYDKNEIAYYEKYGTFNRDAVNEGEYKNSLDFLNKLSTLVEKRFENDVEKLRKIVLKASKDKEDNAYDESSFYEEIKECLEENETNLSLLTSLDWMLSQADVNEHNGMVLVFYYD